MNQQFGEPWDSWLSYFRKNSESDHKLHIIADKLNIPYTSKTSDEALANEIRDLYTKNPTYVNQIISQNDLGDPWNSWYSNLKSYLNSDTKTSNVEVITDYTPTTPLTLDNEVRIGSFGFPKDPLNDEVISTYYVSDKSPSPTKYKSPLSTKYKSPLNTSYNSLNSLSNRSPLNNRYDISPKKDIYNRSPLKNTYNISPKKDIYNRSPKKDIYNRSPIYDRSPKKDIYNRSPKYDRSPKKDTYNRSPIYEKSRVKEIQNEEYIPKSYKGKIKNSPKRKSNKTNTSDEFFDIYTENFNDAYNRLF